MPRPSNPVSLGDMTLGFDDDGFVVVKWSEKFTFPPHRILHLMPDHAREIGYALLTCAAAAELAEAASLNEETAPYA